MKYNRSVEIYSYKVTTEGPNNPAAKAGWAQVVWSMLDAYERGCRIFNFSIGSQSDDDIFQHNGPFCTILDTLRSRGEQLILCCAVGNGGEKLAAAWPARLAQFFPEVISIGAHGSNRQPYVANQHGARVLSYGVNVVGLHRENNWVSRSGTSQAAAVLSAIHLFFGHGYHLGTLLPVFIGPAKTVTEVYEEIKKRSVALQSSRSVGSTILTVARSTDSTNSCTTLLVPSVLVLADSGVGDLPK